ncbi:phosphodiester glycosidase family protein [Paenibacillus macerans]|uniref:phosphodiester glycosidase family protein n=1 Tax=Paenibacillus macerans TaxID=44252 RepID=UPI002432E631|nr:phosphodiester glycosidase family protein [Paenibacillus macerans]
MGIIEKSGRRTLIMLLIAAVLLSCFPMGAARAEEMKAAPFGQVLDERKMEIGPDAHYTWYDMKLPQGLEKVHFVEFDPRNPALELQPGKTEGKVYGMQGVTKMANDADRSGNRVIAAINADFYDMSTGVPLGLFMGDGEILTSPPDDWFAFGMKSDGTTIYGPSPRLDRTLNINGNTVPIHHINRMRFNSEALILYTPSFYTSTMTNDLGDEVELEVLDGAVKSGETMRLRVAAIHKDQGNTPLAEGKVVLSASGSYRELLSGLKIDDEITASFAFEEAWGDVKMAVGGQHLLVKDGVPMSDPDRELYPRVAIGTKADGTVVMLEVDGRAPGFSEGVSFQDLALMLKDMGIVDALLLDGGGSATFVARLPGEPTRKILNRPSDGAERKTANGILLVNKAPESAASKLVVQPNLERVLIGSSFRFNTAAVDEYAHPAPFAGSPNWSVDASVGSIDESGLFTAGNTPGMADISVTAGGLAGSGQVEVVDELSELKFPDAVRTFTSGAQQTLSVTALRNGQVIQADNRMFEWRVEGPIGSIDENGTFTATTETEQSGRIIASYRGIEVSMDVHVGLPPVILEDFENGLDRYLPSAGDRYTLAGVSEETNEDFVRFGNKSAKLEYDFTGTIGTSGAYIKAKSADDYIEIPGYPEKISMWVYGDGKKHWLRAQMFDANGGNIPINFVEETVGVDFTGWRYLEAEVPQGRPLPLKLAMPVRYMETKNDNKDAGAIYIDQIRALYGPANDDLDAPLIKDVSPADGNTIDTNTPKIQAFGEDYGYDPAVHPGTTLIDPDKIRLYVDGELVQHTLYPPKGQIHYTPAIPLTDGVHAAKLKIRDLSGNQTEKEWTFTVDTGAPKIEYDGPASVYAGNSYTLGVRAVKAAGIHEGFIEFGFDPAKAEDLQVAASEKLTETQLRSAIEPESGTVRIDFNGLEASGLTDHEPLAQIRFKVKPAASDTHRIAFRSGAIKLKDQGDTSFRLYGLPVESEIRHHLRLAWDENGVIQGGATTIQVTDEAGAAVEDATVTADGTELGVTDASGKLETNDLTDGLKEYELQAVKGNFYSPVLKFKVSPLAGNPVPNNISVTMGADPSSSRAFTWHTHPDVKETVVEIAKKSEFIDFSQPNVFKVIGSDYLFNTWDIGTVRVHKAVADNLDPGTEYVYRVGDGAGNTSSQGTFRTAAASGDAFEFLYFADSQATNASGFKLWGDIAKKAAAEHPDSSFMVHAGDMVEDGYKENEWNMWFGAAQQTLLNSTIVSVVGNHEVTGPKKNDYFLAHFNHPQNGIDSLKGSNYSFDYLNAHFAVLNSEYDFEKQREWLREDLASTGKTWKIVIFHRGAYGSIYDSEHIRNAWTPVLDEFRVDLALNGHDHVYMRTHPMKGNKPVGEGEGTTYVVAGSTGPKFYQVVPREWQKITDGEEVQMYASIKIDGDELSFAAKTITDRIVDRFTLAKASPQSVVLDRTEAKIQVGGSIKLNATVLPEHANNKSVTWSVYSSSGDNVVTVDADGLVTAHESGTAVVRASTVTQAVYADSVVEVVPPSPGAELAAIELRGRDKLYVGETDQTVTEAVYDDGSRRQVVEGVQYASSRPEVATIDAAGVIRALSEGTTVISAEFAGMSGQYTLIIEGQKPDVKLERLEMDLRRNMTEGETQTARLTGTYSDGTSVSLTDGVEFSSSHPAVAAVNTAGVVRAVREGQTVITATYENHTASVEVTVGRDRLTGGRGKSSNKSNNTPAPPTAPASPPTSETPGRFVVKPEQFSGQEAVNGQIELRFEGVLRELILPGNAGELLESNALFVQAGNMAVSIPSGVIRSLISLAKTEHPENSTIVLKAHALQAEEAKILLRNASVLSGAGIEAASDVMDFSLSLNSKEGDTVWLTRFNEPIEIFLPANPDADRNLTGIYGFAGDGSLEYLGGVWKDKFLTALLNQAGRYAVLEYTKSFTDLPDGHWAASEIMHLAAKHLVEGVSGDKFQPGRQVTRAEFASMLVRLLDLQGTGADAGFADVAPDKWYADEVALAAQAGIVTGTGAASFAPDAPITRQEMAVMIVRAYEYGSGQPAQPGTESGFTDIASAPQWAKAAINVARSLGLVEGRTDVSFGPEEYGTRAESAKLIYNLMETMGDHGG